MNEVINLEDHKHHIVQEVICINCKTRWLAVAPEGLWLKDYVCPTCDESGYVIKTGQEVV